jgi:hypothetical protein
MPQSRGLSGFAEDSEDPFRIGPIFWIGKMSERARGLCGWAQPRRGDPTEVSGGPGCRERAAAAGELSIPNGHQDRTDDAYPIEAMG